MYNTYILFTRFILLHRASYLSSFKTECFVLQIVTLDWVCKHPHTTITVCAVVARHIINLAAIFMCFEHLSFVPYPLCECVFSCFLLCRLAIPSNFLQLGHIINMFSLSLSNAVTSLPVKTPSRCVSTLELFSGEKRFKAVSWHQLWALQESQEQCKQPECRSAY